MELSKDILLDFQVKTGFDSISYFASFQTFMKTDYNYLIDYYNGKNTTISKSAFKNLQTLLDLNDDALSFFSNIKYNLNNTAYYDLLELFEETNTALMTAKNLSKWLRSPITSTGFGLNSEVTISLNQSQTLELFNKDVLNNSNEDAWVDIAKRNQLTEEDYNYDGGNPLKVTSTRGGRLMVNVVVDNLSNENILGIDLDQTITFVDDDLKALSYIDTFKQSVNILAGLKKGDDPYLSNLGTDRKLFIGSNVNILNIPILTRGLNTVFSTDDTIKGFTITNVHRESDAMYISFTVTSILDELNEFKINLSN